MVPICVLEILRFCARFSYSISVFLRLFFYILVLKIIACTLLPVLCNKKNIGHRACLRENEHLFRFRVYLVGNLLHWVCARNHLRTLIPRKSCPVGMGYAILGNHLNSLNCWTLRNISFLFLSPMVIYQQLSFVVIDHRKGLWRTITLLLHKTFYILQSLDRDLNR